MSAPARRTWPVAESIALAITWLGAALSWACVVTSDGLRAPIVAVLTVALMTRLVRLGRESPPLFVTLPATLLPFLALWPLVAPSGQRSPASLISGIVHGWDNSLAAAVPVPATTGIVGLAAAMTLAGAAVSAELLLRTRTRIWPLVPALLTVTIAYALGRGGPSSVPIASILVVVGAVGHALLRSRAVGWGAMPHDASHREVEDEPANTLPWTRIDARPALLSVGALLLTITVAVLVLPGVGNRSPQELHDDRKIDLRNEVQANPLNQVNQKERAASTVFDEGSDAERAYARFGPELFAVTLDSNRFPECTTTQVDRCPRFPIAYLDVFGAGGQWSSSVRFSDAAQTVTPPDAVADRGFVVDQRIELKPAYPWPVLPGLARIVGIAGVERSVSPQADEDTGLRTLVPTAGSVTRYTVTSRVNHPDRVAVARGIPDGSVALTGDPVRISRTAAPRLTDLRSAAGRCLGLDDFRPSPQYQQLCAFERIVKRGGNTYRGDPSANFEKGHSIRALEIFLSQRSRVGSTEQFTATFATLARSIGIPVRIAVGYEVVTTSPSFTVRANDLRAWPEVAFKGLGWVAFSPFPNQSGSAPTTTTTTSTVPQSSTTLAPTTTADVEPPPDCTKSGACGDAVGATSSGPRSFPWPLAAGSALFALIGLAVGPGAAAARKRRRERITGSPATRVSAAWRSAVAILAREGADMDEYPTTQRAVAAAHAALGEEASCEVAALGAITDRALHARPEPGTPEAEAAWSHSDTLRALITSRQPRRIRMWRWLTPRRRHTNSSRKTPVGQDNDQPDTVGAVTQIT